MHEISGQVAVQLAINGQELDLIRHRIDSVIVRNHVLYHVPTMEFRIQSKDDLVQQANLVDGTPIDVSIGQSSSSGKFKSRSYRVFRVKPLPSLMMHSYEVSCYYNQPGFFVDKATSSHEGTAKDVIQQLAQAQGIQADVDTSSDHQVWRNTGLSPAAFIRRVVMPRMYGSDNSAYLYGYSSISDRLRVKDISQILNNREVVELTNSLQGASSSVPAAIFHEYSSSMSSGSQNANKGGYGLDGHAFDLTLGSLVTNKGARVSLLSGLLNLNASLAGKTTRILYDPVNVGNTHDNYNKARVQNSRIIGTYTNHLELLVGMNSGCDMLDPVSVKLYGKAGTATVDQSLSGKYICVGVDMLATSTDYAEKVHLVRNSIDVPGTGMLIA